MVNSFDLKQLGRAKLFDVERLCRHFEQAGYMLFLEKPKFAAWEVPYLRFSFFIPDRRNEDSYNLSISGIMKYLTTNNLLDDADIIHSWEAHEEWYLQLQEVLEDLIGDLRNARVSLPYDIHSLGGGYVYSSDEMVIRFIEMLLVMSDVSVNTVSMESQQIIIGDAVDFAVNELIPALYSDGEFTHESATVLMLKVCHHIVTLSAIYCL